MSERGMSKKCECRVRGAEALSSGVIIWCDLHAHAKEMERALQMVWDWNGGPSGSLSCVAFRDKWEFQDHEDYGEAAMWRTVKEALA